VPVTVGLATPLASATDCGMRAAADGGNALDAALAAAAHLTVAYPHNCSIGGDLLALVRNPDGHIAFINASGRAPKATDVDAVRAEHSRMPLRGPLSVTVPGLVSGWGSLHALGAKLDWSQLMSPAAAAAREGVSVSPGLASAIADDATDIEANPALHRLLAPGGRWLQSAAQLRQPALAATLERIATHGADAFYRGPLAEAVVAGAQQIGIPLTSDDLAGHTPDLAAPLSVGVNGWVVASAPPNSQGFALLRLLALFDLITAEGRAVSPIETAQAFMAMTQQRDEILADPDAMNLDIAELLTQEATQALAASLPAINHHNSGSGHRPNGDTVAIAAADTDGWSVSLIQSVYYGFGSLLLDEGTGVLFHNRGACFSLDPQSPNVLAPGKRPLHTLTPVLAEREHERLAVGCMGGEMQPQILFQVMVKLLHGLPAQDAVGAPRWTVGPWDRDDPPSRITHEANVDPFVLRGLADWRGPQHSIPYGTSEVGHAQAVRVSQYRDEPDVDVGTDPRADGAVHPAS